jgi:glucose 1-dehydrogenase
LKGQVALVTGASSGIGRAIALAMADEGASVVVNYIGNREPAQEVVAEIQGKKMSALAIEADVSDQHRVRGMFDQAIREFGTIDILVSNAGIEADRPYSEMTLADWQKVLDVNLTGGFLCSQEAVREFRRRGIVAGRSLTAGKIIFISSVHQEIPWARHTNYSASKGGLKLLMESLAQEVAAYRIRVNGIAPGAIRTNINKKVWDTPEGLQSMLRLIPWGRIGEPVDVAAAAVWLASDESDYVHGTTLFVDGGMTLYPGFAAGG